MTTQTPEQAAIEEWVQKNSKMLADYLFSMSVLTRDMKLSCRWIVPHKVMVAEGWAEKNPNDRYWLVAGSNAVLMDYAKAEVAKSPREALRHFALKWQLQAERIRTTGDRREFDAQTRNALAGVDMSTIADSIAEKAEYLYSLTENDVNWDNGSGH
ncbi:MAG: DUF4826 family protein [Proteobacteria bacterium]|nr:DUF4826 family protein [Pseudomonadota bacterium]